MPKKTSGSVRAAYHYCAVYVHKAGKWPWLYKEKDSGSERNAKQSFLRSNDGRGVLMWMSSINLSLELLPPPLMVNQSLQDFTMLWSQQLTQTQPIPMNSAWSYNFVQSPKLQCKCVHLVGLKSHFIVVLSSVLFHSAPVSWFMTLLRQDWSSVPTVTDTQFKG